MKTIIFSMDAMCGVLIILTLATICTSLINHSNIYVKYFKIFEVRQEAANTFYHYAYYTFYNSGVNSAINGFENKTQDTFDTSKICYPLPFVDTNNITEPNLQVRYFCKSI